ncbi:MAG TPA: aldolase [Steroidobacteraceae bacterium]|jgi:L-fuculose-phosphate aldolase|nr:aldolase [Steroidobacteraceae bacterium]
MDDIVRQSKKAYHERFRADIEQCVAAADWTVQERVALACRILHRDGHDSALAGQISARGERPGTYWTLSFGLGLDEARPSNVLLVDDELDVLAGDGMANPANRFHLWIYRARPEVNAIVHTHAPHASALSLLGEELVVAHMDMCVLYENCAYLAEWPGVPIGDDEGRIISEALGDKPAVLLAHHGLLTATESVERAVVLAFYLERAAKMHLCARAVGPIRAVDPELAREARGYRGSPKYISATFNYLARCVLRETPECLT